jgi:hypothetical protein
MIRRLIAMFAGGMGAVVASQAPEFAQQYAQRLGGAVDELKVVVEHFDQDAARVGLDRAQGLQRLESADDRFVAYRGSSMRGTVERLEALQKQQVAMRAHDILTRVGAMAVHFDTPIAKKAAADFRPAIPLSAEGFFLGLLGFLLCAGAVAWPLSWLRRKPRDSGRVISYKQ